MTFATIHSIETVLEAIRDKPEFCVMSRFDHRIVSYNYVTSESFAGPYAHILRECRGIVFDASGHIVSRPLHKFFNVGEKEHTQLHVLKNHKFAHYMDKLDGSMIHVMYDAGAEKLRWLTKRGLSEVAQQAEAYVSGVPKYAVFARFVISMGLTPIFEWCSPFNKVVVGYQEPTLVLLAVRDIISGMYFPLEALRSLAVQYDIPVVSSCAPEDIGVFVGKVKNEVGVEGYVLATTDGELFKIKTDWYLRLHKGKDMIDDTRSIIELSYNGNLDDIVADLDEVDQKSVNHTVDTFWARFEDVHDKVKASLATSRALDRKAFATQVAPHMNKTTVSIMFAAWSGDITVREAMNRTLEKALVSNKAFQEFEAWMDNARV